jgi:hypothetical protein
VAFAHGKETQVLLDAVDVSALLNSWDLNVDVEPGDTTTFKKDWKTFIPGLADATAEASGFYDETQHTIRQTLQTTPDSIVTWNPGGDVAVGDQARMMAVVTSNYKESSPVGGVVEFSWGLKGDDTLGVGHVYHVLGAETVTGFSTYVDGGAATLLGAVAHLHILAKSGTGSPTLTAKFRDATSGAGAGLADISGGAFTAATVIGAQRLVIPGTIRQFVRVDWTISGTTPSFTFAVALARKQ